MLDWAFGGFKPAGPDGFLPAMGTYEKPFTVNNMHLELVLQEVWNSFNVHTPFYIDLFHIGHYKSCCRRNVFL